MDANSGRIATQILIRKPQETVDDDGFPIIGHEYLFNSKPVWCEWVNAHGSEFYNAASLNLREPATLTMRYSPLITVQCQVERKDNGAVFDIISIDNIRDKRNWLEIKVSRVVAQP